MPRESWTDEAILTVLDLWDHGRLTARDIAARFGTSRSAILGLINRIERDADEVPSAATKPENRDGGMLRGWWKKGRAE